MFMGTVVEDDIVEVMAMGAAPPWKPPKKPPVAQAAEDNEGKNDGEALGS